MVRRLLPARPVRMSCRQARNVAVGEAPATATRVTRKTELQVVGGEGRPPAVGTVARENEANATARRQPNRSMVGGEGGGGVE